MDDLQPFSLPCSCPDMYTFLLRFELFDVFFLACTLPFLLVLRKTNRQFRTVVTKHIRNTWDINKHLRRFFEDPLGFRVIMRDTGAIISGSQALQFFLRTWYPGSDLDIYVTSYGAPLLCEYLRDQGYTRLPPPQAAAPEQPYLGDTRALAIRRVLTYEKDGKVVQVIYVKMSPIGCVLAFHSTCVTNYIAWDHAGSFYPGPTLLHRVTIQLHKTAAVTYPDETQALLKYEARGFTVIRECTPEHSVLLPTGTRRVGDRHSLIMRLPRCGILKVAGSGGLTRNRWSLVLRGGTHAHHQYDHLVYADSRPYVVETRPPYENSIGGGTITIRRHL